MEHKFKVTYRIPKNLFTRCSNKRALSTLCALKKSHKQWFKSIDYNLIKSLTGYSRSTTDRHISYLKNLNLINYHEGHYIVRSWREIERVKNKTVEGKDGNIYDKGIKFLKVNSLHKKTFLNELREYFLIRCVVNQHKLRTEPQRAMRYRRLLGKAGTSRLDQFLNKAYYTGFGCRRIGALLGVSPSWASQLKKSFSHLEFKPQYCDWKDIGEIYDSENLYGFISISVANKKKKIRIHDKICTNF